MAQVSTTGGVQGVVNDPQGAGVPGVTMEAVHEPSGTVYVGVTGSDGRFQIPGMRVGGPYTVKASLAGFRTETVNDVSVTLGVFVDLTIKLSLANVTQEVTVVAQSDPVFSTGRTGAATAVSRVDLATLPTISGRLTDLTRLSPQYGGSGTFVGQDNRANNVTVDGSSFNNSFGLGVTTGAVGDRTGVAPISLEAVEQVQVNVAPYDVRLGNFTGATVNTVTRSGTNKLTGSFYYRMRNESYVGKEAKGQAFNPGTFDTTVKGGWAGGPIKKNKWFAFFAYEKQDDSRPINTLTSNPGGVPVGGNVTRVLTSDLAALSAFVKTNFGYDTGPFDNLAPKKTPATPWMLKSDFNINNKNKLTVRYNQLDSSSDILQNGSSALGTTSRNLTNGTYLGFQNTDYSILENLKSGVGEWNAVFSDNTTNNLLIGYTTQDESRGPEGQTPLFPFVIIHESGTPYTAFGNEPFTPYNLLKHHTFQIQDSFTKIVGKHTFTFGGNIEKFHSDNSFYFGIQSSYTFNSLDDFYTAANAYLANPNQTVSPVTEGQFYVKYLLQPGQTTPPLQQLDVLYGGAYAQDEWRLKPNLTLTYGLRVDVPKFNNTAFDNPSADALLFRNETDQLVPYDTAFLPKTTPYWSPRVGFNYDVANDRKTQVRGGTGLFSGRPPYVWISNQIGNTGVLYGSLDSRNTTAFPFNPNPDAYKPAPTGGTAASYELDVTDPDFRFPQTWRSNIGVDRRLPGGLIGTLDYVYNRDVNAPVYLNGNLPEPNSAFTGTDPRARWVATPSLPACVTTIGRENGPCLTKLNNATGNQITNAYILTNQDQNRSWNISGSLSKTMSHGFSFKGGFNYGVSRSESEPSSTAGSNFNTQLTVSDPNHALLAYSSNSPGKRVFFQANYTAQYFKMGATTVSIFYDGHTNGNSSFVFASDANGDTISNDLIYIPRDQSEMNFKTLTSGGVTFTPAQQAAAFDDLIANDPYLSAHRGEYAERNAVFLQMVNRIDFSLIQDVFGSAAGARHAGQIRLDITNFGNLLNHNWGVGTRLVNGSILTNPSADASGALTYNLATISAGNLLNATRTTNAGITDVYVAMLSFRYTFN
jgi:hypothetical protein